MATSFSQRVRRYLVLASFCLALATPVPATITDDINPMDSHVYVTLVNPDSQAMTGVVAVTALVAGSQVTATAPFRVSAHGRTVVRVSFNGTVTQAIAVTITEGPDPV